MKQSLRLQTIATKYSTYLDQFYAQRPNLAIRPYADQHAALMADSFGAPETRSAALGEQGYEINHVFANAEPMQKRWALENGVTYNETNWSLEITEAQVKAFRPDILCVNNHTIFTAGFLRKLKSDCSSLRLIMGWCGAPYRDPSVFREYDIVFSCVPELVQRFRENGHCSYHLNHAFDPRVLERIDTERSPKVDFAFLGSIAKGPEYHHKREKLILELVKNTDLSIWSEIHQSSVKQRLGTMLRRMAYDGVHMAQRMGISQALLARVPLLEKTARWEVRPNLSQYVDRRIARRARPPLFGVAMFQRLHDSKVALNTHIDFTPSAANMRLYEATGVGTCLLTDWKANLSNLFEPEVEVVTYRNAEECIEKVRYLLDHEDERQAIAVAGQHRTLRDHTAQQRAEQIDDIIQSHLRRTVAR